MVGLDKSMEGVVDLQYDLFFFQTDIISKVMLFKGKHIELHYVLYRNNKHYPYDIKE